MKPKDNGLLLNRKKVPARMSPLPVEWMDPMSWRLPSGKALAEFALQSGFLAPLMLGGPRLKKRPPRPVSAAPVAKAVSSSVMQKSTEVPDTSSGSFRETR